MAMLWRHHKRSPEPEPELEAIETTETILPAVAATLEESLDETEDAGEDAE